LAPTVTPRASLIPRSPPTRQRRCAFFGNIAFPRASQTNTIRGTRAYLAANLATWQTAADNPTQFNRTAIQNQVNPLKARLDAAAEGRPLNGPQKCTANIFANSTFPTGATKGLRVGSGFNFVGRRLIGNQLNQPFDDYLGEARGVLISSAGYDFRIGKTPVNLQLNGANVLDYSRPGFTNTTTKAITNNRAVGNGYFYEDPRKVSLGAQVRF
jgi:hypothetical protein